MWFGVISLFPELFQALKFGVTGRALQDNRIQLHCSNPRDFTIDKHQTVDAKPYGGGPGMLMMAPPLLAAIQAARAAAPTPPKVVYLSPQGKRFDQAAAEQFAHMSSIILIAGRYEGIDERVIEQEVDEEWSIGDYILTGGEFAALVMIDTITRLLPGVVGDEASIAEDSLTSGLLKYPQYTRPENLADKTVPSVLLSGNHQAIARWRLKAALGRTWQKRPDLLAKRQLNSLEQDLLDEFIQENMQ